MTPATTAAPWLPAAVAAALVSSFGGFTLLSLAMDRHRPNALDGPLARRRLHGLRAAGTVGLLLSLATCLATAGTTRGWVLWLGVLTAAAVGTVLLHTWASRWAGWSALVGLGAGVLIGMAAWWKA